MWGIECGGTKVEAGSPDRRYGGHHGNMPLRSPAAGNIVDEWSQLPPLWIPHCVHVHAKIILSLHVGDTVPEGYETPLLGDFDSGAPQQPS